MMPSTSSALGENNSAIKTSKKSSKVSLNALRILLLRHCLNAHQSVDVNGNGADLALPECPVSWSGVFRTPCGSVIGYCCVEQGSHKIYI